jgi:tRNA pseudouridine55 synthase
LAVECSGGTYIRCLIRDIGIALGTRATMTSLVRTKQGAFLLENSLDESQWNAKGIYEQIRSSRRLFGNFETAEESS